MVLKKQSERVNLRVSLAIAGVFHYGASLMTQTVIPGRLCYGAGAAEDLIRGGTENEQENATEAGSDEFPPRGRHASYEIVR